LKILEVDWTDALLAVDRDYPFRFAEGDCYLDLETGEFLWVYEEYQDDKGEVWVDVGHDRFNDEAIIEENRRDRARVEANRKRYLLIPIHYHGEIHEIFKDFVDAQQDVSISYFPSIGGWFAEVRKIYGVNLERKLRHAWDDYRIERQFEELKNYVREKAGIKLVIKQGKV